MSVLEKVKSAVDQKGDKKKEPVVIKKYANRRLYNTETSTYVTLEDLAAMVRSERDFVVYDAKTTEDLTHSVLTQIIVEQEARGSSLLPVPFLRQLIRFYGDSMGPFVPHYLQMSMEMLANEQEKYRQQFAHLFSGKAFTMPPFGSAAFEALQERTRQNMALFERALSMFSPFHVGGGSQSDGAGAGHGSAKPSESNAAKEPSARELEELRTQVAAMQAKIEKIAGKG
jgi:polyhydroxyalkanoate synthesis repressor PhaR